MPLLAMSPNVQELESASRKRSHDDYARSESPSFDSVGTKDQASKMQASASHSNGLLFPNLMPTNITQSPPGESSPVALTEAGSSTPARNSPTPNTPTRQAAVSPLQTTSSPTSTQVDDQQAAMAVKLAAQAAPTGQPPAKRKRLTAAEKEQKEKEKKEKQEAREAKAKALALEKEEKEKARAARAAEKDAEKKAKQEEKDKKRREKEDEERRTQEEKDKKERAQMKIGNFFKFGPSTPNKKKKDVDDGRLNVTDTRHGSPSPSKETPVPGSVYKAKFMPFFVKDQVRMAHNAFEMDPETKEVKSSILDAYIRGEREPFESKHFDPIDTLHLPSLPIARGRTYPSVRKVMAEYDGTLSTKPIDLTTESQNAQIKQTRNLLSQVPMKFLGFKEDVRPAYFGTVTTMPKSGTLQKLARKPISKDLLPLNYDYDSEAEWQDDGEGEDVDDLDDDDEDLDDDEEMGDFLDDSEDAVPARPLFNGGIEPESTGICWENRHRLGPLPYMYKFRMEFMLGSLDRHSQIDPFSTKYWDPEPKEPAATAEIKSTTAGVNPPTITNIMPPPPTPTDAFTALTSGSKSDPKKTVIPPDLMSSFQAVILEFPTLSKVGLIEILNNKFPKCTKIQVRTTLDLVAERVNKSWRLKGNS